MGIHQHIARRRFLKHLGIGAVAVVAVGAGVGGYFLYRQNEISATEGLDAPIVESKIGALEQINAAALSKELESQTFVTSAGRGGWRVQIPGNRPLATPAVSDGLVFIGGGYGSHEFYAFDANNGKVAWQLRTKDDGPTAAVVFDERVCFNTESCTLYVCRKRTGEIVWDKWLGDPLMNQPAVARVNGRALIFMAYPGQGGHRLIALELEKGKTVWDQPIDSDLISAPVISNGSVYASAMSGIVYRFSALDGKLLEERKLNATSAPWVDHGEIHVSNRQIVKDKNLPQESLTVYSPGREEERQTGLNLEAKYLDAKSQGRLYQAFKDHDSSVGFGNAPSAAQLDKAKVNLGGQATTVIGGWSYQGARPVVAEGRIYNVLGDTFQSVDRISGKTRWAMKYASGSGEDRAFAPPAVVGQKIYTGSLDGQFIALRTKDGKIDWGVELGEPLLFQPAIASGRVFIATQNGKLYSFDAKDLKADGWLMWGGGPGHNGPTDSK
ncbi:PQQ-binding-like beta-propeller repeat protein [Candidatus Acetothermia bacterium]|nr:PQQ-binding-like beta-propeller repeat protein [Candidatus Acetothermia bacterium]